MKCLIIENVAKILYFIKCTCNRKIENIYIKIENKEEDDICGLKINLQVSARCLLELNDEIVEYHLR